MCVSQNSCSVTHLFTLQQLQLPRVLRRQIVNSFINTHIKISLRFKQLKTNFQKKNSPICHRLPRPTLSPPLEAPLSNFEMLSKDLSRFGIQVRSLQSIISFIDWLPAGLLLSAVRAARGSLLLAMLSADEQCHVRFTNKLWCRQNKN